jgi:hypothetical protein
MALGLTLGVVLAVSGSGTQKIAQSALGATATPTVSGSATAAAAASPAAAVPPASSFSSNQFANRQLGDVATVPVDGAGNAINLAQTPAQAIASGNCSIIVPANPLTAAGLATPWQLSDGCTMATPTLQSFVEATILSPNGQLQVYNPLVITAGTTPAATPVAPTIAAGSQVIINVGMNGNNLVLTGPGAMATGGGGRGGRFQRNNQGGNCVDALGQSVLGEVSECNAVNFYNLARFEIARGTLVVPPNGTSLDGQPCLTSRDFGTVDQDQSDNVVTSYLINGNGLTAQNTAANTAAVAGSTTIVNGSDNKLLAAFLLPNNGCTALTAPDTTAPGGTSGSQALNELSAFVNQKGTIALNPVNDPMTLVAAAFSVGKTNVYRSLQGQPLLPRNVNSMQVAAAYCQNITNIQPARNQLDSIRELNVTSPVPAVGNNLATFLANRLLMSFTNLNCANFGLTNPVTVTLDGNMVAIAFKYNLVQQVAKITAASTTTSHPQRAPHKHGQNPAGS